MTTSPTPEPQKDQDIDQSPEQRDAERMKRHYPLSFLIKLLSLLLVLFLIMCIVLYVMAGTSRGTKFIIEKIVSETGVKLEYGEGNLRDGLLVKDVALSASEDIDVHFEDTYVKIGWRAMFAKEVHLRDADIKRIEIINRKPPTGEPFDYKTLELPVNLRFDQARINEIVYNQVGKDPIEIRGIRAKDLSWVGTEVKVDSADIQYSDLVNVANLSGEVDLSGDYPLDLTATITVNNLDKAYIGELDVEADGSLKRTYGKVRSQYNGSDVRGVFTVQGMDDNAPFDAKLFWDEVDLPYAENLNISLHNGLAVASGVLSDIELRINSQLIGDSVPSGQYRGRAHILDLNEMRVERLTAQTPEGDLLVKGILDWEENFGIKALAYSRDYQVRALLPEVASPYAPKYLDGRLAFVLDTKNKDGLLQMNAHLEQRDGEKVTAKIVQGVKPANPRQSAPWYIDATWRDLYRQNVPQLDQIDSPYGTAQVQLRDDLLWVDADAKINKLSVAPEGNYRVRMNKVKDKINLRNINYDGVMGDLNGSGSIILAGENTPLSWDIDAKTSGLKPQVFSEDVPVTNIVGDLKASGKMLDITRPHNGKLVKGQRHVFNISATNLATTLSAKVDDSSENRRVVVVGSGNGVVDLVDGSLQAFTIKADGQLDTQGIPKGSFGVEAGGTPKIIKVKSLSHTGGAGDIRASGLINLTQGIAWDIDADAKNFNVGMFVPQTQGIVTGDLKTSGKWRSNNSKMGDLQAFDIKFNGAIDTPQLPQGRLVIDAEGDAQAIKLRRLSHTGEAGSLSANGTLSISNGLSWNINAVMDQFNFGYFLKEVPSNITGRVNTTGTWQDSVQRININQMSLKGRVKGEPLVAQGKLNATLHLPKDMNEYMEVLKASDATGQVKQFKTMVETLNADNLLMQWGDNQIVANGNTERLQAKVKVRNLSQISDSMAGNIVGGFTLVQPKGQALPTIYVDLTGNKLILPGLMLSKGVIKGKIVDLAKRPSSLVLVASDLEASNNKFQDLRAVFNGTEKDHSLTLKAGTRRDATDVAVKIVAKGGLDRQNQRWKGVIGNGQIETDYVTLNQNQPAQLLASFGGSSPSIQLAAHCWQATDQNGKLCLRENLVASPDKGQVNLAVQDLDTTLLAPFLPKDLSWQAKVNGKAVIGWQKGRNPNINATVYSDNGKVGMTQDGETNAVTLPYKRVSLIVRSFEEGLKLRTDIDSGRGARGYADIVVDPFKENKPISGALVLNEFNLAILKPFFPGMRKLSGGITMAGGLGGTLSSPVFYGDVNLKDATVAMLELPVNLTNINAKGKIRGQSATVNGTFLSGEGEGRLTGTVNWQQELQAKLRVTGERLVITQPPLLFAEVSPDVNIIVKPSQQYVNIVGAVSVPRATIRPPEANEKVVTKSEDVVVLDRRLIGNIDEVLAISKPWSINADIGVDLGRNVNFRGFGAVLPLAGAVHITQTGQGVMNGVGVVQVSRRSSIDAFGQNLELNYAQVRFNGDLLNPSLSIEAVKEIEGQTVGLRVKGKTADPNIVVFNDAGLTNQQAMNALITGRISNSRATQISEEGFKSEVTNNIAAAGLSMGLSGTRGLTNTIGDAFGLERLTIDASGTDSDTNVNVTGYITPDLYIRYGVGVFNAQSSLSLRYQLTRRIYVQATSAAEDAVDMVYSFQF